MIILTLFLPLFSFAADSITCSVNNIPDGKADKFVLLRTEATASLLGLQKSPRGTVTESVLVRDFECANAKSDSRIVNCLHRAPEGSSRVSDVSLTIIKHSYLSAGSAFDRSGEDKDLLTENFRFYFRDDRSPNKEIDKHFTPKQCRVATSSDLDWAKAVLEKNK